MKKNRYIVLGRDLRGEFVFCPEKALYGDMTASSRKEAIDWYRDIQEDCRVGIFKLEKVR